MPVVTEKIYYDCQTYFSDLIEKIGQATSSIDLETYIFDLDKIGNQVLGSLALATKRGVSVRLLVDGFGSSSTIDQINDFATHEGIQFRVYHPLMPSIIRFLFFFRGRAVLRALSQMNKRLHRKSCVIDGRIAFLGSFNITFRENRDTGIQISDGRIESIRESFSALWEHHLRLPKPKNWLRPLSSRFQISTTQGVRLNLTRKMRTDNLKDLLRRVLISKNRVWITNPYFVPPMSLLQTLIAAAKNQVDVRLLVPERSDSKIVKWVSTTYYESLLQMGIRIFEYQRAFLHAKVLIIDDWAMIGSTNLNHRSLIHDLELDLVIEDSAVRASLVRQFQTDQNDSIEINKCGILSGRFLARVMGYFFKIFKYWM